MTPENQPTRTCKKCGATLAIDQFTVSHRTITHECRACTREYKRLWAIAKYHNSPKQSAEAIQAAIAEQSQRLLSRMVARRTITENGCWEWPGTKHNGYGMIGFNVNGTTVSMGVHRVSAVMFHGLDLTDDSQWSLHHCDNPPCWNPDHLFIGDVSDNTRDAYSKGRVSLPVGEARWNALLQESDVKAIRARLQAGETGYSLAKEYGVHKATIYGIKNGKNWRHLQ